MKSAEDTIKWLLQFVDMDFDQFREGDWLNLSDDFSLHFNWLFDPKKLPQIIKVLRNFQETIRKPLVGAASVPAQRKVLTAGIEPEEVFAPFSVPGKNISSLTFKFFEGKKWRVDAGTDSYGTQYLETQCLLTVAMTLIALHESGKLQRLRYCEAPSTEKDTRDCGNLFFAEHGRQQFCSAKCKGREASQRFRYRHKEELRTKAHVRYERKAKAKHGPHVKVSQFRKKKTAKEES